MKSWRDAQKFDTRWNGQPIGWSYIALFPSCYLAGYFYPSACLPLATAAILYSYILIIVTKSVEPVILLAIFARALVGFSAQGNGTIYTIFSLATNYLPTLLLLAFDLRRCGTKNILARAPWTIAYLAILIIYFIIGAPKSAEMIGLRLAPMIFLLIFISHQTNRLDALCLLRTFRVTILISVAIIFWQGYIETSVDRLTSGMVFGQESDFLPLLGLLPRAMGPWWDPRIMGVFGVIYLALALLTPGRPWFKTDVAIALVGVAATLSRGAIVTALLVLTISWALRSWRRSPRETILYGTIAIVTATLLVTATYADYIAPIVVVGGDNPLAQRADFSIFAWNAFLSAPLGLGVGALRNIASGVNLGYFVFDSVTDAFLLILLAEVGIIGFALFAMSFLELAWGHNSVSKAMVIGLGLQMVGTDLPDFGPPYFAMMALIVLIAQRREITHKTSRIAKTILRPAKCS